MVRAKSFSDDESELMVKVVLFTGSLLMRDRECSRYRESRAVAADEIFSQSHCESVE